jgi:hypothetical protein
MTIDFAYTLYLILLNMPEIPKAQIKRYVQKWYVMSVLTGRYVSSPESAMDRDIRNISTKGFLEFLDEVESSTLSDTFWSVGLVQSLETSATNSPYFITYLAAQTYANDDGLFNNGIKVSHLIATMGDIHHIFPKKYLQKNGINDRWKYNQVANYVYLDSRQIFQLAKRLPRNTLELSKHNARIIT